MPKFDDRFARQNRYGPPPEFPLASTSSSIVHHLSGPNEHAFARPNRCDGMDRPTMRRPPKRPDLVPFLPSLCPRVSYCPAPRARVRLLGPCFKTGRRGGRLKPQTPDVERAQHATGRPTSNPLPLRAVAGTDDQRATANRLSRADMESLLGPSAGSN